MAAWAGFVMDGGGLVEPDPGCRQRLEALSALRRHVPRGAALFRSGDPLVALYQVHAGFFKTCISDASGRNQVIGFHLNGELLGLDGIDDDRHSVVAVALEDTLVRVIPYAGLCRLFQEYASLQHEFHRLVSREIVRSHTMLLLLGTVAAEGRVAAFLIDLTQRLKQRGFSASSFVLRMTREEIGSYLGLQLETVSRTFSKLQCEGVLHIRHRDVHVLNEAALRRIASAQN